MPSDSRTNLDKSLDEIIQERSGGGRHYHTQRNHYQQNHDNKWKHDLHDHPYHRKRGQPFPPFLGGSNGSNIHNNSNNNNNSTIDSKRKIFSRPYPFASLTIHNLHHEVSESDLQDLFGTIGAIKKVRIEYDRAGRSDGIAHIQFYKKSDAADALNKFNGVPLDGMPLQISIEENKRSTTRLENHY